MNISQKGIDFIKNGEEFRSKPYDDATGKEIVFGQPIYGNPTIGWGHLILKNEKFIEITIDEAEALLRNDLSIAERTINRVFGNSLTQNQYDALVSFCFNVGAGDSFIKSNVVKYIKLKMYEQAIYYWKQWNKVRNDKTKQLEISEGLINRRNAEIELFQGR